MLKNGMVSRPAEEAGLVDVDQGLLRSIVHVLANAASGRVGGLREALEPRTFVDLLAAAFQLVYGPADYDREDSPEVLQELLDG